jgi:hypothetical protein
MSDTDLGILQTRGTPNLLEELARGNPAQTSMIQTNRARIDNMRTSAKLRKKELFVDMLIHIMVHSHTACERRRTACERKRCQFFFCGLDSRGIIASPLQDFV